MGKLIFLTVLLSECSDRQLSCVWIKARLKLAECGCACSKNGSHGGSLGAFTAVMTSDTCDVLWAVRVNVRGCRLHVQRIARVNVQI